RAREVDRSAAGLGLVAVAVERSVPMRWQVRRDADFTRAMVVAVDLPRFTASRHNSFQDLTLTAGCLKLRSSPNSGESRIRMDATMAVLKDFFGSLIQSVQSRPLPLFLGFLLGLSVAFAFSWLFLPWRHKDKELDVKLQAVKR